MGTGMDKLEAELREISLPELKRAYKLKWIEYEQLRYGLRFFGYLLVFLLGIILAFLFIPLHFSYSISWGI